MFTTVGFCRELKENVANRTDLVQIISYSAWAVARRHADSPLKQCVGWARTSGSAGRLCARLSQVGTKLMTRVAAIIVHHR